MDKILIVEDDASLTRLYEHLLSSKYELMMMSSAKNFVEKAKEFSPSLLILDINLESYENGFDIAKKARQHPKLSHIPILFVTSRNSPEDLSRGLNLGAEDYLEKPFRDYDLIARIDHRLRKAKEHRASSSKLKTGDVQLDTLTRQCSIQGEEISLSPSEFQILVALTNNVEKTVERSELGKLALGQDTTNPRLIDSYIRNLRKKSEYLRDRIESIYGVGYRLKIKA